MANVAGQVTYLLDWLFADGDFFAHDGGFVDRGTFFAERNANLLLSQGASCRPLICDGSAFDDELFAFDRNLDGLVLGNNFFADASFSAVDAIFVNAKVSSISRPQV